MITFRFLTSRPLRFFFAGSYSYYLTRAILTTNPWEIFGAEIAGTPPIDIAPDPLSFFVHIGAYAVLGGLVGAAVWKLAQPKKLFALILCVLHGFLCEKLQGYIPNRWPNLSDAFANLFGLVLAAVLLVYLEKRLPSPSPIV